MLHPQFTPFPVLQTRHCHLRQLTEADAPEMLFLRSSEEVMRYIDRERTQTEEEAKAMINMMNRSIATNDAIVWGITLKGSDELIGNIAYWRMEKEHYRAEIGYVLHPQHWGKGIMSEVLQTVLHFGFETIKLHSIEADVNPENAASIRLLEKQGFVREGYFRENFYFRGRFLDSAVYSLLQRDFKKLLV